MTEAEEDRVLEGTELVSVDLVAEELNLDDLVLEEVFVQEPEPVADVAAKENPQNTASAPGGNRCQRIGSPAQEPVKAETPTLPQELREEGFR